MTTVASLPVKMREIAREMREECDRSKHVVEVSIEAFDDWCSRIEAALASPAGEGASSVVQGEDWQQRCLDLGFKYWRAPDAHGVECTHEQALALLRDLLGVEVDFTTPPAAASSVQGEAVAWPKRMVNLPCPDGSTDRIIGFRVPENDPILGEYGLSEPLAWLRRVTVDRYTTPPPAPAAEQGDETGPYPHGAGLQQSPGARYWQQRAEFWMGKAISLGWREVRDAANGEAPAQPEARGVEGMDFLRHVASVCREAVDLCEPKPQRTPEDDREHNGGLCLSELANIADEIERRLAATPNPVRAEQPEGQGAWKLVPVEPTPEMLAAVRGWTETALVAEDATCEYPVSEDTLAEAYRAMLAAAPAAPGAAVGVDEAMVFRLAVWMAERDGHDDPHHLIWEGSPPEPWGEVWNRYEGDARAALTAALAGKDDAQ